jgi:hypothetical protein
MVAMDSRRDVTNAMLDIVCGDEDVHGRRGGTGVLEEASHARVT